MKLKPQEQLLLYSILRSYVPSDDWTQSSVLELVKFNRRLAKSLQRGGYDMKEYLELLSIDEIEVKNQE